MRTTARLALAAILALNAGSANAGSGEAPPGARRNHLAGEASPYLQMHVLNPVDWYPWGDAAFAKARAEDKPIFLSVGYSTCYWCHVMERKVFSDPAIAALMNASFVNVKVDREERPDVDEVYMQATRLLTGSGGWPNSVFLTSDGKPFFAGTYFPPTDARGRPGFPTVLGELVERWQKERGQLVERADRVAAAISANFAGRPRAPASFDVGDGLARGVAALGRRFDPDHGGFGRGTKFPSTPQLELLLAAHRRGTPGDPLGMLTRTLDQMAFGGIHDHLGGGFHRYSTEPTWSVPHFEKMLYDNAQLLGLYARAHGTTGSPLYRQVAIDIADYLASEMTSPGGGFYSAQDAEVDQEEGRSYVWTTAEVEEVLGVRAKPFLLAYRLAPLHTDTSEPGVLRMRLPVADVLAQTGDANPAELMARFADDRARLLERRRRRPQPLRDDKVLAGWNGLAIRGLVDAGVELRRSDLLERAARAANFVLARLRDDGGALRRSFVAGSAREAAVLDDYAFLADGLVALHAATGDPRWLASARALADRMLSDFEGPEGAGFYLSAGNGDLFTRPRVLADNVRPSGNAVALRVLRDLSMMTGQARYREAAARTEHALGALFEAAPEATGTALRALTMGPQLPAPPLDETAAAPERPSLTLDQLPTGRDFVSGELVRSGTPETLRLRLQIQEGWHVNANPASLDFLIPTRIEAVDRGRKIEVRYPGGAPYHPRFSLEPLSVYEGEVEIELGSERAVESGATFDVTFQACDESSCLPPETVRLRAP